MNASLVGALLLCRADPEAVRPTAQLLREQMLLAPAGDNWSVLVPEGGPWADGGENVDTVVTGWAAALSIGSGHRVLALWCDGDRAGFTLAAGFRRPVGYIWLADGTPVGEDEAMRTFGARLGLDPVLDLQDLEPLTVPDPESDARIRLLGLTAVLARTGLELPAGLVPGSPADSLRAAALAAGAREVAVGARETAFTGRNEASREGRPKAALRPERARVLGAAQLAVGLPLLGWALYRRSAGWTAAGAMLVGHGALALSWDRLRTRA